MPWCRTRVKAGPPTTRRSWWHQGWRPRRPIRKARCRARCRAVRPDRCRLRLGQSTADAASVRHVSATAGVRRRRGWPTCRAPSSTARPRRGRASPRCAGACAASRAGACASWPPATTRWSARPGRSRACCSSWPESDAARHLRAGLRLRWGRRMQAPARAASLSRPRGASPGPASRRPTRAHCWHERPPQRIACDRAGQHRPRTDVRDAAGRPGRRRDPRRSRRTQRPRCAARSALRRHRRAAAVRSRWTSSSRPDATPCCAWSTAPTC